MMQRWRNKSSKAIRNRGAVHKNEKVYMDFVMQDKGGNRYRNVLREVYGELTLNEG